MDKIGDIGQGVYLNQQFNSLTDPHLNSSSSSSSLTSMSASAIAATFSTSQSSSSFATADKFKNGSKEYKEKQAEMKRVWLKIDALRKLLPNSTYKQITPIFNTHIPPIEHWDPAQINNYYNTNRHKFESDNTAQTETVTLSEEEQKQIEHIKNEISNPKSKPAQIMHQQTTKRKRVAKVKQSQADASQPSEKGDEEKIKNGSKEYREKQAEMKKVWLKIDAFKNKFPDIRQKFAFYIVDTNFSNTDELISFYHNNRTHFEADKTTQTETITFTEKEQEKIAYLKKQVAEGKYDYQIFRDFEKARKVDLPDSTRLRAGSKRSYSEAGGTQLGNEKKAYRLPGSQLGNHSGHMSNLVVNRSHLAQTPIADYLIDTPTPPPIIPSTVQPTTHSAALPSYINPNIADFFSRYYQNAQ